MFYTLKLLLQLKIWRSEPYKGDYMYFSKVSPYCLAPDNQGPKSRERLWRSSIPK